MLIKHNMHCVCADRGPVLDAQPSCALRAAPSLLQSGRTLSSLLQCHSLCFQQLFCCKHGEHRPNLLCGSTPAPAVQLRFILFIIVLCPCRATSSCQKRLDLDLVRVVRAWFRAACSYTADASGCGSYAEQPRRSERAGTSDVPKRAHCLE